MAMSVVAVLAPAAHAGVDFDDVAGTVTVTPEREPLELDYRERYSWSVRPVGTRLEIGYSGGYPYPRIDPVQYDTVVVRIRGKAAGAIVNPGKVGRTGVRIIVQSVGTPKTTSLWLSRPGRSMRVRASGNTIDLNADGTTGLRFVRTRIHFLHVKTNRRGNDLIDFGKFRPWAINVFPRGIGSTITTYRGNDRIIATPGQDTIYTGAGNNILKSLGGRDEIRTGHGNNRIWAGPGDDEIILGNGNNRVWGGPGPDWIVAGKGRNVIRAGSGDDHVFAGKKGGKPNYIWGGPGNDGLTSHTNGSRLYGGSGQDILVGTGSRTRLNAGRGNDSIRADTRQGRIPKIRCGPGTDITSAYVLPHRHRGCEWYWADGKAEGKHRY